MRGKKLTVLLPRQQDLSADIVLPHNAQGAVRITIILVLALLLLVVLACVRASKPLESRKTTRRQTHHIKLARSATKGNSSY